MYRESTLPCLRTFWAKDSFLTGGFCFGSVVGELGASKDDERKLATAAPAAAAASYNPVCPLELQRFRFGLRVNFLRGESDNSQGIQQLNV